MQQGQIVSLEISDLADSGDGVGRYQDFVVFVPNTVPGDRIAARLLHVKSNLAYAQIEQIIAPSRDRVRPGCIVADKCGGCQWQAVSYPRQLDAKQNQVIQALHRIGGFSLEEIAAVMQPMIGAESTLGYRNKVTYPLEGDRSGKVKAGYYQKGSHKIVNLNQCPVQDNRLDPLLAEVKQDIQALGGSIYDEQKHTGLLRHLGFRIGRHTGEILLTLIATEWEIPGLAAQAKIWMSRYPQLVGVLLNRNPDRTNAIFGKETRCLAGRDYLEEIFAGLRFQLRADTFFQVYTEQAEKMLAVIQQELKLTGTEILLDAYAGVGTLTLPLARQVKQAIALEVQPQATAQAEINAAINQIDNVKFYTGKVEHLLSQSDDLDELKMYGQPDIVLLDPPRKGCHGDAIAHLRDRRPQRLVYVSCNPTTLARDLKQLCVDRIYCLTKLQMLDFFPQTAHVESVAFLTAN
jgi:23S rRNA (uracil1939-C5)-methyltransferase